MISSSRKVLWYGVSAGVICLCATYASTRAISSHQTKARRVSPSARALTKATQSFLDALSAEGRTRAMLSFDSEERLNWNFVPMTRKGLSFKEMNAVQRQSALQLLRVGLSAVGFAKTEAIRALEPILSMLENNNPGRDAELYYFTVFGVPSIKQPWGLRYEGHHISLNWTIMNGQVIADSPQFLGANPARVPQGPHKGERALAKEEDLGRALLASLNAEQKKLAVLSATAPPEILTGSQRKAAIQKNEGLDYHHLDKRQRTLLMALIEEHAATQPTALARQRLSRLRRAGLDDIKFAWMGSSEVGQGHYYRVQGPTFLIEYDNTQNDANHIHTVWRDFDGDFGADLLGQHLQNAPHDH